MVSSVTKSVNLPIGKTTMNVSIHEDNLGALVLGKTLPHQFTPQSKYYAIKTIWFREEIFKRGIQLHKIDTVAVKQLGDIFTKGLTQVVFEYLQKNHGMVIPFTFSTLIPAGAIPVLRESVVLDGGYSTIHLHLGRGVGTPLGMSILVLYCLVRRGSRHYHYISLVLK
jgi:hypothetical protein